MIPSRPTRAIKKGMGLEVEDVLQNLYSIYDENVERIGRCDSGSYYAVIKGERVYITPEEYAGLDKRMMRESMAERHNRRWREMNDALEDARLRSILGPPPQTFVARRERMTGRCRDCGHDFLIPETLAQVTCPGCKLVYNIERLEEK